MIGTSRASENARVSSRSKPALVPSRSILVSKISPAPAFCIRLPHSIASSPVERRPPWVKTSQRGLALGTRFASMAMTMHCAPYRPAASSTNWGFWTAAVLILTLSAPAFSKRRTSSTSRTPPPTVSGMNTCEATCSTIPSSKPRSSELAVMSRKVSSSAPCSSYRRAISTGSPASRKSMKLMPLTTRPPATSKQGMIRLASMMLRCQVWRSARSVWPQQGARRARRQDLTPAGQEGSAQPVNSSSARACAWAKSSAPV